MKEFSISNENGMKITPVDEQDNELITTAIESLQPNAKDER